MNCNRVNNNKPQPLSLTSFPQVSIAPKENVTYEKQTQTTSTQSSDRGLLRKKRTNFFPNKIKTKKTQ